jgi:hypothetical protein
MATVLRFPVERTRPAPLYADRLYSADILILPAVRIERAASDDDPGAPQFDASSRAGHGPNGRRRRNPRS